MGLHADVLVIGSGITGLTFALKVARRHDVLVITKKRRADSNTNYARGGIATGFGTDDDPRLHLRDTLAAGDGLCHEDRVELVVREGPERVRELVEWGVGFHREGEGFSLGKEGGHSRRRIVHAGDRTGREIERALLEAVEASDAIRVVEDVLAVDFLLGEEPDGGLACGGVWALDHRRGERVELRARATLLASGGCGQVYRHTTNPAIATGDGVAMAHRAGVRLANLEFIQFHPTALHPTEDPAFLISEAIRGEGAVLRRLDGAAFMEGVHPDGSLAPRDVVARAIHREMRRTGDPHVVLDVSSIPRSRMESRFPAAVEGCRARGIDLFTDGIPVVPAAHYVCGGVLTDVDGRTSLPGLYSAGEVACTGVHGANRLASNSLLEAVVFSHRAAMAVMEEEPRMREEGPATPASSGAGLEEPRMREEGQEPEEETARVARVRSGLRDVMWERVGIVRTDEGLARAAEVVDELLETEEWRWTSGAWTLEAAELRNLLRTGALIVECARRRKESRGLHYNLDHPERDDVNFLRDTVLEPGGPEAGRSGGGGSTTGTRGDRGGRMAGSP